MIFIVAKWLSESCANLMKKNNMGDKSHVAYPETAIKYQTCMNIVYTHIRDFIYSLYIFNLDQQFVLIFSWQQTMWNYDICTVVVSDVNFVIKNNPLMKEQTLITKRHVKIHYRDVKLGAMASQITSLTIVYSTIYFQAQIKEKTKLCVTGFCAGKSPGTDEFPAQMAVTRKNFPFDDVIMMTVGMTMIFVSVLTSLACSHFGMFTGYFITSSLFRS